MKAINFERQTWNETSERWGWGHKLFRDETTGELILYARCCNPKKMVVAVNCLLLRRFRNMPEARYVWVEDSQKRHLLLTLDEFDSILLYRDALSEAKDCYLVNVADLMGSMHVSSSAYAAPSSPSELFPELSIPKDQRDKGIFTASRELALRGITTTIIIGRDAHGFALRIAK